MLHISVNDLIPKTLSEGASSNYVEPLEEEINIFSSLSQPEPMEILPADNAFELQGKLKIPVVIAFGSLILIRMAKKIVWGGD